MAGGCIRNDTRNDMAACKLKLSMVGSRKGCHHTAQRDRISLTPAGTTCVTEKNRDRRSLARSQNDNLFQGVYSCHDRLQRKS